MSLLYEVNCYRHLTLLTLTIEIAASLMLTIVWHLDLKVTCYFPQI